MGETDLTVEAVEGQTGKVDLTIEHSTDAHPVALEKADALRLAAAQVVASGATPKEMQAAVIRAGFEMMPAEATQAAAALAVLVGLARMAGPGRPRADFYMAPGGEAQAMGTLSGHITHTRPDAEQAKREPAPVFVGPDWKL